MAHFAELDKDNIVIRVVVIGNEDTMKDTVKLDNSEMLSSIKNISGKTFTKNEVAIDWEDEKKGKDFCNSLYGGTWVQTSYNGNIRKQYAGTGYTYDSINDVFISQQPYPSWSLDKNFDWQAPVTEPDDGKLYYWDEKTLSWIEMPTMVQNI